MPLMSHRFPDSFVRKFLHRTLTAAVLTTCCAMPALADDAGEVSQLLRAGQYTAALNKADAALKQNPRDPQLRFLKGVILTEQNKSAEAIDVFTKLSKDYPALPEPYNNLAVLYAASGEYDKARLALDQAIRTNPTYATAYENLGDVHAKLASQAYDKALQLDQSNNAAKSKLTMVRSMVGNTTGGTVPPVVAAPARPTTPVPAAAPASTPAAPQTSVPAAQPKPTEAPKPVEPKPDPATEQKRAEAEKRKAEQAKQAAAAETTNKQVLDVVEGWASAWSARNVEGYLKAYSSNFALPAGQSRKAWEVERRARIEDKSRINVRIQSPQVSVNGDTATVRFRQVYESNTFKSDSRKTLVLVKQGNAWRIQQERVGN